MIAAPPNTIVRPARYDDALFVYVVSQSRSARRASVRREGFSLDEHLEWWDRRFAARTQRWWIAQTRDGLPLGYVRYGKNVLGELGYRGETSELEAEISVGVAERARRTGVASALLNATEMVAGHELGVTLLVALVRPENEASRRLFARRGFRYGDDREERKGVWLDRFVKKVG